MKIRTSIKILLLLTLCLVSVNLGCRPRRNTGCNYDYCCVNGQPGTPFVARYNDGRTERGTIGPLGVGTYPLRGQPCYTIQLMVGVNFGFSLTANPSGADLNAPPPSVTVTGPGGMDGTYGMPLVEYFDSSGYYIGSVHATATSGGTWLTAPTPDLSSVYSGTYEVKVTNLRSDGEYLDIVGSATLNCWGRDRPDSDGDGWYDDEDCYPYDPNYWSCDGGGGGGGDCLNDQMTCYVY
jgi:hypothetical protein